MLKKIMSAAVVSGLLAAAVPFAVSAEDAPAPTTKEECEKVEGMTWDDATGTCTKKAAE